MAQAIISKKENEIALQTPYDRDFVDKLKSEITSRRWDRDNKIWLVSEAEADKAIEIAARYFEIVEGRGKNADEMEEAQIEAEIAQIEANQVWIIENEAHIEEAIDALDAQIGHYSFNSKSAIKGRMCRDRALLSHSLSNARIPVEQLAELQVRGLAAARRLLEKHNIAQLTSRN